MWVNNCKGRNKTTLNELMSTHTHTVCNGSIDIKKKPKLKIYWMKIFEKKKQYELRKKSLSWKNCALTFTHRFSQFERNKKLFANQRKRPKKAKQKKNWFVYHTMFTYPFLMCLKIRASNKQNILKEAKIK